MVKHNAAEKSALEDVYGLRPAQAEKGADAGSQKPAGGD